jgi:hypothetical protein
VVVERQVFEGIGQNLHQEKADDVNAAMKDWFKKRGVSAP